jgi:hypothetical protein
MNEEELKKEIIKEEKSLTGLSYNIMQSLIKDKEGTKEFQEYIDLTSKIEKLKVQKGKLEQKKEDKNKQDEFYNEFDLASNCSKDDKLFKKLWNKYFKQLQKEIGGKRE